MSTGVTLAFDRSPLADQPFFARQLRQPPTFQVPTLPDPVRAVAVRSWEDRIAAEYSGVMLVRHFHGLLVDLNAPADLQELALVMTLQEQQHVALCTAAARALGSAGEVTIPLDDLQFTRTGDPADELIAMVAGTYAVGEVTALGLIRHTLAVLPPSGFRDVLKSIASDEGLHARIGPALLAHLRSAAWFDWPGDESVRALVATQRATMSARDVIEPDEAALFEDPIAADLLPRVGIPDSRGFLAAYHAALHDDVRRGLEPLGLFPG